MQNREEMERPYSYQDHIARHQAQPESWNIVEYLRSYILITTEARNYIERAYNENSPGYLGRIFNSLPSLDTKTIDEFAEEYLREIKKGSFAEYTLRKVSDLLHTLIDCNQTTNHAEPNPHYGQLTDTALQIFSEVLNKTPDEIKAHFYGDPIEQKRVMNLANQMYASLMIAMTSRFTDIKERSQTPEGATYKDFSHYNYLFNGFKMSEDGLSVLPAGELTFKDLNQLNLDALTQRRELNPQSVETNQSLRKFVEHIDAIIEKWQSEPLVKDALNILMTMKTHALVIISGNDVVAHNYVSQRKEVINSYIDEQLHEEQPKATGSKSLLSIFNRREKKATTRHSLLGELQQDINHGIEPASLSLDNKM
ncbi:Uncharacterised protein [Legionella beliardensis]|uniref:Uncharacterized protein n=1 Tax=Legionella beliardensis TaxID=91822 RepID=A0A378I2F8_9GAMM|nr:hypothetical protein [Legionella beliardensis]STX28875.1 Uncharacterised protein [Legionella beliardensis]